MFPQPIVENSVFLNTPSQVLRNYTNFLLFVKYLSLVRCDSGGFEMIICDIRRNYGRFEAQYISRESLCARIFTLLVSRIGTGAVSIWSIAGWLWIFRTVSIPTMTRPNAAKP